MDVSHEARIRELTNRVANLELRLTPSLSRDGAGVPTPYAVRDYPDENTKQIRFFRVAWPLNSGDGSYDEAFHATLEGDLVAGPPVESIRPFYYDPNVDKWLSFETFSAEFGYDGASAIAFGTLIAYLGRGPTATAPTAYRFWSAPDDGYIVGLRSAYITSGSGDPDNAAWGIQVNEEIQRRSPIRANAGAPLWFRQTDGTFYIPVGALDVVSVTIEKLDPGSSGTVNISQPSVSLYFKMARPRDDEEFEHGDIAGV